MAYQVGDVCYPTAVQAAQAMASSQVGSLLQRGTELYSVSVDPATPITATLIRYRLDSTTGVYYHNAPFVAQPCVLEASQAANVAAMGDAFVLLLGGLCVLFFMKKIIGLFSSDTER